MASESRRYRKAVSQRGPRSRIGGAHERARSQASTVVKEISAMLTPPRRTWITRAGFAHIADMHPRTPAFAEVFFS